MPQFLGPKLITVDVAVSLTAATHLEDCSRSQAVTYGK